jgi:MATE family, multidrug efflux pump
MKDLTKGPIPGLVLALSIPLAAGMLLQTIYFFVDLYFVARLGDAAIAGVSAAGNLMFLVFAMTQMLSVGTVALVSQAVGRKDQAEANHVFNQSVALGALCAVVTLAGGYAIAESYMRLFAANEAIVATGVTFLDWFLPGLALQYALAVMASGLRGTGIVKPTMVVQALTVVLNALLAPVLIAGWLTGRPLGVAGAALATTISVAAGVVALTAYFLRLEHYVAFDVSQWKPQLAAWRRILNIGLPSGGEFAFIGIFIGVMYWAIRDFGGAAQAGFGVGSRINQMIFVPAMAVSFAVAPIAGQNFGARQAERVRETFRVAAIYEVALMIALTALVQWQAEWFARLFTAEPDVVAACVEYLRYISWNFIGAGIIWTCSALFQGIGNTWPPFAASGMRILIFALPAIWMARQPWFEMRHAFMLSVATVLVQAVVAYLLLRRELAKRLTFA